MVPLSLWRTPLDIGFYLVVGVTTVCLIGAAVSLWKSYGKVKDWITKQPNFVEVNYEELLSLPTEAQKLAEKTNHQPEDVLWRSLYDYVQENVVLNNKTNDTKALYIFHAKMWLGLATFCLLAEAAYYLIFLPTG